MHIFHTTSAFERPNISRNTFWNCNFSLPFKNLPLKLLVIQTSLQKLGRDGLYYVLNISYFIHFTSNISGQQCMGLEAALAWKTCTFGLTNNLACKQFHLQKAIELHCNLWKLSCSKWTEIIVEIQLIWFWLINVLSVIRLWSYGQWTLLMVFNVFNSWYTPPNSPFT